MAPAPSAAPTFTLMQPSSQPHHQHGHRHHNGHQGHRNGPDGSGTGTVKSEKDGTGKAPGSTNTPTLPPKQTDPSPGTTTANGPTTQPGQPPSNTSDKGFTPEPVDHPIPQTCGTAKSNATDHPTTNPRNLVDRQGYYLLSAHTENGTQNRLAVVYYRNTDDAVRGQQPDTWTWCDQQLSKPFYQLNLQPQSFPLDAETGREQKIQWCIKAPHASDPTLIGDECGVAVDDVRGYLIFRVAQQTLFKSWIDGVTWDFKKEYVCVDKENSPPTVTYPDRVWLCVTADSAIHGRRHGVAAYYSKSSMRINQGEGPDDFAWLNPPHNHRVGAADPNASPWENELNTASLTAPNDFMCCINADANLPLPNEHVGVGTAMYTQDGLIVWRDTNKDPVFDWVFERQSAGERLTFRSSYFCARRDDFWQGGFQ